MTYTKSKIFLLSFLIIPSLSFCAELSSKQLKHWERMLYYKKGISDIDSKVFFISPNGKKNSTKELKAAIHKFFIEEDQNYICRFPDRFNFLNEHLKYNRRLNYSKCPKLVEFLKRVQVKSASLVFSSYHLNSPASAFGHTLIKLNRHPHGGPSDNELKSYALNFAADVDTKNAFVYGVKGMTGLFKGKYSLVPYYYKIREYNDYESRDLWSYNLKLSPKQIQKLTLHTWELGANYADYYYLTENCSYFVARILEAIVPDLYIYEQISKQVIPVDTVKEVFKKAELIHSIDYRPSLRKKINILFLKLTSSERRHAKEIAATRSKSSFKRLSEYKDKNKKLLILDGALHYYDYLYAKDYLSKEQETLNQKRSLLIARSKIRKQSKKLVVPPKETDYPNHAHPGRKLSLLYKSIESYDQLLLKYRASFHDLLDPLAGHPRSAEIILGEGSFGYNFNKGPSKKNLFINHFDILKIKNLTPIDYIENNIAWEASIGGKREFDQSCFNCFLPRIEFNTGINLNLNWFDIFFLVGNEIQYNTKFKSGANIKFNLGPIIGIRTLWPKSFVSLIRARYSWSNYLDQINKNHIPNMYSFKLNLRKNFTKSNLSIDSSFDIQKKLNIFTLGIAKSF